MDRSTLARTGIAGAIAGLGLTVGGIAMASAETETGTAETTASASAHPGGPRGDRGQHAADLAEALGLEEDVVKAALDAVRDQLKPDTEDSDAPRTPPTDAERAARQAALATALAAELDISEAKVTAALAELEKAHEAERAERRADARVALVERLDAAVEDGTLTAADKASVLKAFDADLIGGGFGRGPGGVGEKPAA